MQPIRAVVLNRGSIEPQGFGEPVSGFDRNLKIQKLFSSKNRPEMIIMSIFFF